MDKCINYIDGKKNEIGRDEEVIRTLKEQIIVWNTKLQKHTEELTILTDRLTKMTTIKDEKSHFFTVELKDSKYQLVL